MSAMSDIDDVQRLIKSGRWIDVGELLTAQRQANKTMPAPCLTT